jgi:hypothetical protein
MSKLLLQLSFICLAVLVVGTTLFPNNSMFWLATGESTYQYIRGILAFLLLTLLLTRPPRNIAFRVISGLFSVGVGMWTLEATYSNHMMFLDSLSLLAAAFSIAITTLEIQSSNQTDTDIDHTHAKTAAA